VCREKSDYLPVYADLHLHTRASDGELRPSELIYRAHSIGVKTIAVTDHDTLTGLPEAICSGKENNISIISGIELSAVHDPGTMHILGYFPAYPQGMEERLFSIQEARRKRCPLIIRKLNALGLAVTLEDVTAISGTAQIGRPHIAKALINKGLVRNSEEAFSRYLAKGKPAFVDKEKMTIEDAISLIIEYKGLCVLAHPFTLGLDPYKLKLFIRNLNLLGLAGLEVFYPEHSKNQKRLYTSIARDLGMLITGGTDYHGPGRNRVSIGDFGIEKPACDRLIGQLADLEFNI